MSGELLSISILLFLVLLLLLESIRWGIEQEQEKGGHPAARDIENDSTLVLGSDRMRCPLLAIVLVALIIAATALGQEDPPTLFLTWAGDPTSSIVIQWLEQAGELPAAESPEPPSLPRVGSVNLDGSLDEWAGRGLSVPFITQANGEVPEKSDFSAALQAGWNDDGLVFACRFRDDKSLPHGGDKSGDRIEVSVANPGDESTAYRALIIPNSAGGTGATVEIVSDSGRSKRASVAMGSTADGEKTVEALLPWALLGVVPAAGARITVTVDCIDEDPGEASRDLHWDIGGPLRLGDEHAGTLSLSARILPGGGDSLEMAVDGPENAAGRSVDVMAGEVKLGSGLLESANHKSTAVIPLASPPEGTRWAAAYLVINDQVAGRYGFDPFLWKAAPEPVSISCTPEENGDIHVSAETTVRPFGNTGWYARRATFEGLKPDTAYLFRIGETGSLHRFVTAPATLTRPIVFAEGGDIGSGPAVPALHGHASSWDPLFALVGGDIACGDGVNVEAWVKYLELWNANMLGSDDTLIPMIVTIGNHEVAGGYDQTPDKAPLFRTLFDGLFAQTDYAALDFGNYLSLILLDSGHTAPIAGSQTDWLKSALEARADRPYVFAAYHMPAYPSVGPVEDSRSSAIRKHWVPLFQKFKIDAAFEHHDHAYKRTNPLGNKAGERVIFLGDGAWGMGPRTPVSTKKRRYLAKAVETFNVIRVTLDESGCSFHVVNDKGEIIDDYPPLPAGGAERGGER